MPAELLRSARFICAVFGSWKILVSSHIIMLEGLYPRPDRKISPQYYLLFLLSLLSVAYTQFTYWLFSVVLKHHRPLVPLEGTTPLWACKEPTAGHKHLSSLCNLGLKPSISSNAWKMNVLSDIAIGCRILYVTNFSLSLSLSSLSLSLSLSLSHLYLYLSHIHTHTHTTHTHTTHTHTQTVWCLYCACVLGGC